MLIGYARVSTDDQSLSLQRDALTLDFGRLHLTQICLFPQVQTVLADNIQFPRHLSLCFAAMDHQLHRLAFEILPYLRAILLFFTVVLILL